MSKWEAVTENMLQPGDHVMVKMNGFYNHHGIVSGVKKGEVKIYHAYKKHGAAGGTVAENNIHGFLIFGRTPDKTIYRRVYTGNENLHKNTPEQTIENFKTIAGLSDSMRKNGYDFNYVTHNCEGLVNEALFGKNISPQSMRSVTGTIGLILGGTLGGFVGHWLYNRNPKTEEEAIELDRELLGDDEEPEQPAQQKKHIDAPAVLSTVGGVLLGSAIGGAAGYFTGDKAARKYLIS